MMTKTIAILTIFAALVVAVGVSAEKAPAATQEETVDCEYVVTPKGATLVKGGDNC